MTTFVKDVLERAGKTFVQVFVTAFVGALVVPADVVNWDEWKSVLVAAGAGALAAALSAVTSAISSRFGDPDTASLLSDVTVAE